MSSTHLRRSKSFSLLSVLILLFLQGLLALPPLQAAPTPDQSQPEPTGLSRAKKVGRVEGPSQLEGIVALKLRDTNGAEQFASEVVNPASSYYQQFLTPAQFQQRFGLEQATINQLKAYFESQNFQVTVSGTLLTLKATAATFEQVFQVQLNRYSSQEDANQTFFAADRSPYIGDNLKPYVQSVQLHNRPLRRASRPINPALAQAGASPNGLGPTQVRKAYNLQPLLNAGIQGQGQSLALVQLTTYSRNDITVYAQQFGINGYSIQDIVVNPAGLDSYGAGEASLDIELAIAVAPQLTVLVYEAGNSLTGLEQIYSRIVNDNRAPVTSSSWGQCENYFYPGELDPLHNILMQGVAQGLQFFSASGDSGAYDCNDTSNSYPQLRVDYPASDPYSLGVGGTTLSIDGSSNYLAETTWASPTDKQRSASGGGTGGGLSTLWNKASWQQGPGVTNMYSNGRRQVPDIAANSDPSTGYAIYCTVPPDCSSSRPWIRVGGTSAAAPFWAAAAILVNQYVGKRVISGPRLYQLASQAQTYPPFHDITSGNNLYYPATGGYDLATGLGTPDIFNLARDLAVTLVAPGLSLALNPAIVLTNSPATLSFNLTNPNGQALTNVSFSLNLPAQVNVAAVPGISNSCGGGTISAGGSNGTIAVSGVGLAANQSCTISLKISSATPGSWYISMAGQIMANESPAGNATNGVTLKVVAPIYASYRATPGGTFVVGATPVGQAKAATFTISNGGDPVTSLSVALSGAGLSGANANEFSLSAAPSFPVSLAGGQSQTVTVGCNPTVLGTRTAKLTLNTNDSNLPVVTYNLICVGAYVVTVASDDGSGTQPGTLSYVLVNQANSSGQGVTFNLGGTNNTIAVKGVLPKVPAGVTLDGGCNNGKPGIVLDGSAIPTALPDGLVLNGGNNLIGLQVTHFKGRQIVAGSNRNQLRCVVANK